jgi:hypothetical protein
MGAAIMEYQATTKAVRTTTLRGRLQRRSVIIHNNIRQSEQLKQDAVNNLWQQRAVTAYRSAAASETSNLQAELVGRIAALTGQHIAPESVYVSQPGRLAVVNLEGMMFRLQQHTLVVLAPCAHCGVGQFESPAIETVRDLGFALAEWQPLCPHCNSGVTADWMDSDY